MFFYGKSCVPHLCAGDELPAVQPAALAGGAPVHAPAAAARAPAAGPQRAAVPAAAPGGRGGAAAATPTRAPAGPPPRTQRRLRAHRGAAAGNHLPAGARETGLLTIHGDK